MHVELVFKTWKLVEIIHKECGKKRAKVCVCGGRWGCVCVEKWRSLSRSSQGGKRKTRKSRHPKAKRRECVIEKGTVSRTKC